jgi:phosphosulfolactate phosphohydrolase-like enzyme
LIDLGYAEDVDLCASVDVFEVAGVLGQEGFYAMGGKP